MSIWENYMREITGEGGEEKKEEGKGNQKEEVKVENNQNQQEEALRQQQYYQYMQQRQQQMNEMLRNHVIEARVRFINDNPHLAKFMNEIYPVAVALLTQDYQSGKLRYQDFYDYLKEASKQYRDIIVQRSKDFQNIRFKEEKDEEEKTMSREEYRRFYIEEYLPSITKSENFIESVVYPNGVPASQLIRGKDDWKQ